MLVAAEAPGQRWTLALPRGGDGKDLSRAVSYGPNTPTTGGSDALEGPALAALARRGARCARGLWQLLVRHLGEHRRRSAHDPRGDHLPPPPPPPTPRD